MALPPVGTRVSLRYRRPEGSVPPLTDVVGHLLETGARLRVRSKSGDVVEIAAEDVVAVRALTAAPVRASQIRAMEHAAALAWPGTERQWLNGWLLRSSGGQSHRANSAVPLGVEATVATVPAIVDWYAQRGQTPWLAVPDRLLSLPAAVPAHLETIIMVRDLPAGRPDPAVTLAPEPDAKWLRLYERDVSTDVLTAVVDGVVTFATRDDAAVGRAAVTAAPDGSRWAGMSAVRVVDAHRRRGHARELCAALMSWASAQGAQHCYVQVLADNAAAIGLYEQLGFTAQHRARYYNAVDVAP
ncbi:N-acetylglutamate synthase, CG3035 family [Mycolicibacterium agri]|uniref:N-acetylglutamate synthase, CG3035 family n=1 Tax=Mycolicibacterium agri TaxID=36811 RepID=UPI00353091CA